MAGVLCLPEAEDGNHEKAQDQRSDDLGRAPRFGDAASDREGDEDKEEGGGQLSKGKKSGFDQHWRAKPSATSGSAHQEEADDVELRRERADKAFLPVGWDDLVVVRAALGSTASEDEDRDERER